MPSKPTLPRRPRENGRTYEGRPCRSCGNRRRYVSNKSCYYCANLRSRVSRFRDPDEFVNRSLDEIEIDETPRVSPGLGLNLVYAMLRQAIEDFQDPESQEVADSAIAWLNGEEPDAILTFSTCCSVLGLDEARVRRMIFEGLVKSLPELPSEVIE